MRTLAEVLAAASPSLREIDPVTYFGPASDYARGTRMALHGRDGAMMWECAGRLRRHWKRVR